MRDISARRAWVAGTMATTVDMRTSQPVPLWQEAPDPAEVAPLLDAALLVGLVVLVALLAVVVDARVQQLRQRRAPASTKGRADWFWSPLDEPRFEVAVHVPGPVPAGDPATLPASAPAPGPRRTATPVGRAA